MALSRPVQATSLRHRTLVRTLIRGADLEHIFPGLSVLEKTSINPGTLTDYTVRILGFIDWCQIHNIDWETPLQLDGIICMYLDNIYRMGSSGGDANKFLAAVKFAMPMYSRLGMMSLPRSHRAVKSFLAKAPGLQRLPFPWLGLCAVLGFLCWRGDTPIAL